MPEQPEHNKCQCASCFDFGLPSVTQRAGHVGFRLGNARLDTLVMLDGTDITPVCVEALPGPNGYAVVRVLDGQQGYHYCRTCSRDLCQVVKRGQVRVESGGEVFE